MNILLYESYQDGNSREKIVLESLGHKVILFNPFEYRSNHGRHVNKLKTYLPIELMYRRLNASLLKVVQQNRFDLMLVYFGKEIYPDTLYRIKRVIPLVVNWNGDELFNLQNSNSNVLNSISVYDFHCSPRHHLEREYLSKGVREFIKVDWYYKTLLRDVPDIIPKYSGSFVGSWSSKREAVISSISDDDMIVHGWGWQRKSKCGKNMGSPLSEQAMNQVFTNSKISINILTEENRDTINFRNYEIPSQYGFQISERSDRILEIFSEDVNIVCYTGLEELNDKYLFYSRNERARMKILKNSYELIRKGKFDLRTQLVKVLAEIIR